MRSALAALLAFWYQVTPAVVCDLEVDQHSLYVVTIDGQGYKNKRYLTWDDAVKLRDVLIASGSCQPNKKIVRTCSVTEFESGKFAVLRDGTVFDARARDTSHASAVRLLGALKRKRICLD